MNDITFTSRIKPVGLNDFYSCASRIGERGNVGYPWTINESIMHKDVFTTKICDCSILLVTDGDKAFMEHICPTMRENKNFEKIKRFSLEKLKLMNKEYLQAFVIGSQGDLPNYSRVLFNNFVSLLEDLNIPTTVLRAGDDEVHVAYRSDTDELLVSTCDVPALMEHLNSEETIKSIFEEVKLSKFDEFA